MFVNKERYVAGSYYTFIIALKMYYSNKYRNEIYERIDDMATANAVREYVLKEFIEPARRKGKRTVSFTSSGNVGIIIATILAATIGMVIERWR